jgi:hypothetical protein
MPTSAPRRLSIIATFGCLLAVAGCGGSAKTSTMTAPSPIARCAVTLGSAASVPAPGGAGSVSVSAARECQWTASVDGAWLSIKSGASGQGDGSVEFTAAANPDPVIRRGAIVLNDARAEVTQAAGECVITLAEQSASFGQEGGAGRVDVRSSSQLCTWRAESDVNWIVVRGDANGKGTATVQFDVMSASGPSRTGTLRVAGQQFVVTQSQGCAYTITPATFAAAAAGGSGSIAMATAAGCTWTATSTVPWLTLSPASGEGPGSISFSVAPTEGAERTGTAVIGGQTFTVTQSQGCSFAISPSSFNAPASGGSGTIAVATAAGCTWPAASNTSWLALSHGGGTGPGSVGFTVAASTGAPRTGTATIGGQTFTVTQGSGCSFTVDPLALNLGAAGGTGTVRVSAPAGCAWTASSNASWITVIRGASGAGDGTVDLSVAATGGAARTGSATIAGQTVTVAQASGCALSLSALTAQVGAEGGSGRVTVSGAPECSWTAVSTVQWLQVTAGASGAGTGEVTWAAAANTGTARSGVLTIAGQTFTVNQAAPCTYAIDPAEHTFDAAGGTVAVNVQTSAGCRWATSTNDSWLTLRTIGNEEGNGRVEVTASANPGALRTGTATIAGRTFTVQQGTSACTYTVKPLAIEVDEDRTNRNINVSSQRGCAWTAVSNVAWIRVFWGGSGTGDGNAVIAIDEFDGPGIRKGTLTVAGQTVEVTQRFD